MNGVPIWQRNYHDRIIRNDHEMGKIWQYIESNPLNWAERRGEPPARPYSQKYVQFIVQ